MSNLKGEVESQLKDYPQARERKNKYLAVAKLLKKNYWEQLSKVSDTTLQEIVADAIDYNRHWQRLLQLNPEYRGSDYKEKKKILEQQAQQNLGYTPGFHQDVKKLTNIYAQESN